jgi:histone acetyltransferase (RNA polymerase elongator complex component)
MRHYNIPIFIPELACPHQCVFCDQRKIAGRNDPPPAEDVTRIVQAYLATMTSSPRHVDIAFFGGSFTGLPLKQQEAYLSEAYAWVEQGKVNGIRLSTRPDYIDAEVLRLLRRYGVTTVEIGAQSMDEEVLRLSERGHTVADVETAARLVRDAGISLVLQMMTGLPGDTREKTMHTARRIAELGATATRIYPALVIRGTRLGQMMQEGLYQPLDMPETIVRCMELVKYFESQDIRILRLGLHPSEGLVDGHDLLAGPFHPALKEMVISALWDEVFASLITAAKTGPKKASVVIWVPAGQLNAAAGHKASNRKKLQQYYHRVTFKPDPQLTGRTYHADIC